MCASLVYQMTVHLKGWEICEKALNYHQELEKQGGEGGREQKTDFAFPEVFA